MKTKPTKPRNPKRDTEDNPKPATPINPPRETKIGVRMQVVHGSLPKGVSIESRPDGDYFVWDGIGDGLSYVSMQVGFGPQRGVMKR